jgi:hypothetical protein
MRRGVMASLWARTPFLAILAAASAIGADPPAAGVARIAWDPQHGVTVETRIATVHLDGDAGQSGPVLHDPGKRVRRRLISPTVEQTNGQNLVLRYQVAGPDGDPIEVLRRIAIPRRGGDVELIEEFALTAAKTIRTDLEIERPFSLSSPPGPAQAVLPLYSGWARSFPLTAGVLRGEWQLGNRMTDVPSHQLGLPMVQFGNDRWLGAVSADPYFGSLYELSSPAGQIVGAIRYRYAASKVPILAGRTETRHFGLWLSAANPGGPFGRSVDSFFRLMLPDVPAGPDWLHGIAMVGFDFLSDGGQGWEKDVQELARLLKPAERRRVALCFHGWYENLGGYSFDVARKEIKPEWMAMGRTRKVHFTRDGMRRKLQLARDLGFRVLLYFNDGLLQDTGTADYRPQWDLVRLGEGKRGGWTGPDTWGETFARNPAHPEVCQWYHDYLAALLQSFGPAIDGFVWDETFYVRAGTITLFPQPAYCDRAMMQLVKSLRAQVKAADPGKVLLASDCIHAEGLAPKQDLLVGYALVADGTYQDTECSRAVRSYGLFPNWRNTLWDCCWDSLSRFADTQWGVEHYGMAVAIASGWGDDRGPSKWTPPQRERFLRLFRWRLSHSPVRFVTANPENSPPTAPEAK